MAGLGQSADRAQRLLILASVLQLGRPFTYAQLRGEFGLYQQADEDAARQQFERDKATLRSLGVDVATVSVDGMPAYRVASAPSPLTIAWSSEEAQALALLAAAVGDEVTGGALAKVTSHLGDFPAEQAPARVRVDLDADDTLARAIAEQRRVTFPYRNAQGGEKPRTVEPWRLATRRGLGYLVGFDVDRGERRVFRLDRIAGAITDVGAATHDRPAPGTPQPLTPEERSDVRLRIETRRLPDAVAIGANPVAEEDRTVVVALSQVRDAVAIGWALRYEAEVLAPPHVAAAVARGRDRLAAVHAGEPSLPPLRPRTRRRRRAGLSEARLTRLLALPDWLTERPGVTVDEIATAFGCTVEDVEAELELLEMLEFPRYGAVGDLQRHPDGQLEFTPWTGTPRPRLSAVEALHLLSLVEAARHLLGGDEADTLAGVAKRLRDVLPAGTDAHDVAVLSYPAVGVIRGAIADDREVAFVYHGRKDPVARHRRVAPQHLLLSGGNLYLQAHDLERGAERLFRLDRMSEVAAGAPVDVDLDDAPIEPVYAPADDEVTVELVLDPSARWILTLVAPTATAELDHGRVHAAVPTDAPEWLLSHVRAAAGGAEVLRPAELRARLT